MNAIVIVHWPGQDTPACAIHAEKLVNLGRVMGFNVSSTVLLTEQECTNCVNEAKKKEQV
jgi:hypothetical protein